MPLAAADKPLAATLNMGIPLYVAKSGDETVNNSAALQNDDHLIVAVEANAVYECRLHVVYTSNATPGYQMDFTAPAGATLSGWTLLCRVGGVTTAVVATAAAGSTGLQGTGADVPLDAWGRLVTSSTAGNFQYRWAQSSANASNTITRSGSFLVLRRVA